MSTLDEIIRLCDIPWIQERWEPKEGDRVTYKNHPRMEPGIILEEQNVIKEFYVYLPLNFDPDKCMNQLDGLLIEAGGFEEEWMMFDNYEDWRCEKSRKQDYVSNNETIAKLTWLHKLIERRRDAE